MPFFFVTDINIFFSRHVISLGTVWTASAHIITAVIGSGVLSLAWATAQLGWIAGPTVLFMFSFVTYYTSCLLASCYRTGDPNTGMRNYTYMEAVRANLGKYFFGCKIKLYVSKVKFKIKINVHKSKLFKPKKL